MRQANLTFGESRGSACVCTAMLLGALLVTLLTPVPPLAPKPAPIDVRAECLKRCAGAPKDAKGTQLLACLQSCEPVDAGVTVK